MTRVIVLIIGLLVLTVLGIKHTEPPKPKPSDEPVTEFSAARAMPHVQQTGQRPHPMGTAENAKVRQYIIKQINGLGLAAEVMPANVVKNDNQANPSSYNIIVKIAGKKPNKAVLLVAHYDSVRNGPGAADDAASVAAILETLRALSAWPPLQNDVICLLTDGEEDSLFGAKAFIKQTYWLNQIGLVLNFEYRGNSGAFLMFETSDNNGKLIAGLAQAVPFIQASSLMYEVYKRLPNDTDFTVFKNAGVPGMNFAAIEGLQYYHSKDDRPELLNQGTLQHEGDIMLALVKHFGNLPIAQLTDENSIYFDFPGIGIVHYPASWAKYVAGLLVAMWFYFGWLSYKAKTIRLVPSFIALIVFPALISTLYFANHYLGSVVLRLFFADQPLIYFDNSLSYGYFSAVIALNIALFGISYALAKKWLFNQELALGITTCWLIGVILLQGNGASFVLAWPMLGVLLALLLVKIPLIRIQPNWLLAVVIVGCTPGLLILVPLLKNLFVALTVVAMPIIMTLLNLLSGLMLPLLATLISKKPLT